jgi:uncharacterized protein (TIGR03435 family)
MMTTVGVVLFAAILTYGQSRAAPGWKILSVGSPERTTLTATSIDSEGISLKQLLSIAYDTPQTRIRGPEWLETERRSIVAIPEDMTEQNFKALLRRLLAEQFKVTTRVEKRTLPVYLMKRRANSLLQLQPAASAAEGTCRADNGLLTGHGSAPSIAVCFEWLLNRPVVDETGLSGQFQFEVKYPGTPAVLLAAAHQLGLELVPAERELELLTVEIGE